MATLVQPVANLSLYHERLSCCTEAVLVNCCIGDEEAKILASTLNSSVLEKLVLDQCSDVLNGSVMIGT